MQYTAEYFIENLKMVPHREGGWCSTSSGTFGLDIPADQLPGYSGSRNGASVIYYMLRKGECSGWHTLLSDEVWIWQYGGSLEMSLGGNGEKPAVEEIKRIGLHFENGEQMQALVPAKSWQTTKVLNGDFVLVSCIVSPAFHYDDFFLL